MFHTPRPIPDVLDLALDGVESAVRRSKCTGVRTDQIRALIRESLSRPTTLYSYQFEREPGEPRIAPEALEFRILDPAIGVLYEIDSYS